MATMMPHTKASAPAPVPTPTPTPTPQTANPPGSVSLAQGPAGTLVVTWANPAVDGTHAAATGFNLQFSLSGAGAWTTVSGVASPYSLAGLAVGTSYDVQLQSTNAAGVSAWSAISTPVTVTAAPNAPGSVSLANGNGSDLVVAWTAPAIDATHGAATGFNLHYSPTGAGNWTLVSGVSSPYDLSGLPGQARIDVQLQGTNAAGSSVWSATSTLTTGVAGPQAPNAPAITSVVAPADGTVGKLVVTWTAPAADNTHGAATGYNIRTSPSGANTWTVVTGVTSPYTLTGLTGGAAIDVEVQATNAATAGAWSAATTVTSYSSTISLASPSTSTSIAHNTATVPAPATQAVVSGLPTTIQAQWSTSATTVPTAWQASSGAYNTYQAVWYLALTTTTNTPGSAYIWVQALNSSNQVIGELVSGPYTIT